MKGDENFYNFVNKKCEAVEGDIVQHSCLIICIGKWKDDLQWESTDSNQVRRKFHYQRCSINWLQS